MASPLEATKAAQQIQQQMSSQAPQQKEGVSKFDEKLRKQEMSDNGGKMKVDVHHMDASKIQANATTQKPQQANHVNFAQRVEQAGHADKMNGIMQDPMKNSAQLGKERIQQGKEASPVGKNMMDMLGQLESGQKSVDGMMSKIMKNGGKGMSMQELMGVQMMAQKYALELDLSGKVVQTATNGLKETLKTQV